MTVEELKALNLSIDATQETALYVEAAIDWLLDNTILVIDKADLVASVEKLPAGAKLFICRFYDVMSVGGNGVTSESIGGMSQSFSSESKTSLIWQHAKELIGKYLKGQVQSIPNVSKWV